MLVTGLGLPTCPLTQGPPAVRLLASPVGSTEWGRDPCVPLHALCGALHPRCVFLAPFQACSVSMMDSPLLDQVRLASRGRRDQRSPKSFPTNQGLTPGWGDCSHPPYPKNWWGQVLPPSLRPQPLLGPPPPQREHHPWAAEAPSLILEPQAFRAEFCWGGGAWPLLQRLLLRCWLAAPTALWLCVVMKPLEIKATLPGSFAAR